jgi:hypothetical protein
MESTQRLALPVIVAGQAQKEIAHNEALQIIDLLLAGAVEEPPRSAPPPAAQAGQCFIVDTTPSGAWAGMAGHVAAYTTGGWRFIAPVEGMRLHVRSEQVEACYAAGGWELGTLRGSKVMLDGLQILGPRAAAIANPSGGAQVDAEARSAISAILASLRAHGLIAQ